MSKKLVIAIVAVVLIAAVVGSCFALYYVKGDDVEVTISAGYESYTLQINDVSNNFALVFEGGDGTIQTTKTVDLTLTVNSTTFVNGDKGVFKIALTSADETNGLFDYVTTSVNLLTVNDQQELVVGDSITTAAFSENGYRVGLTTPTKVRVTFALTEAALANYAAVAGKSGSIAFTWTVAPDWTYDADAYYLVGTFSGQDKWFVNEENKNVQLTDDGVQGENVAQVLGIHLSANDEYKVVKGNRIVWYNSWEPATANFTNTDGQMKILTSGTYNIYLAYNETSGYRTYIDLVSAD